MQYDDLHIVSPWLFLYKIYLSSQSEKHKQNPNRIISSIQNLRISIKHIRNRFNTFSFVQNQKYKFHC